MIRRKIFTNNKHCYLTCNRQQWNESCWVGCDELWCYYRAVIDRNVNYLRITNGRHRHVIETCHVHLVCSRALIHVHPLHIGHRHWVAVSNDKNKTQQWLHSINKGIHTLTEGFLWEENYVQSLGLAIRVPGRHRIWEDGEPVSEEGSNILETHLMKREISCIRFRNVKRIQAFPWSDTRLPGLFISAIVTGYFPEVRNPAINHFLRDRDKTKTPMLYTKGSDDW